MLGRPVRPPSDEMATIRPYRRSRMCGTTARIAWKTPVRFVSIISRQSWSESSHTLPVETIPAFATRMSICPKAASAASATRATAVGSRTSASTAMASPPASLTSDTVRSRSSAEPSSYRTLVSVAGTSHRTTRAPRVARATASARPWPRAPPVMIATCPSSALLMLASSTWSQPPDENRGQLIGHGDHRVVAGVQFDDLLHTAEVLDEPALLPRRQRAVAPRQHPAPRDAVGQARPVDGLEGEPRGVRDEHGERERPLLLCHPVGEHPLRHPQRQLVLRPAHRQAQRRYQRVEDPLALGRDAAGHADDPAHPVRPQPGRHPGDGQPGHRVPDQDDVRQAGLLDLADGRLDAVGDAQGVEVAGHALPPGQVDRKDAGSRRFADDRVNGGLPAPAVMLAAVDED